MTDDGSGRRSASGAGGSTAPATDVGRDRIELPDEVGLPRLLDLFDLQTAEHTGIHEFYEHLHEGQLTTTRCADCDALHFPPRIVCPECLGDDLAYVDLPHRGELYAFTEVRAGGPLGFEDEVPFVVGLVDLGEVRLSARIDGAEYDDLAIGDPVELQVLDVDGPADYERAFFRFAPVEA